MDDKIYYYRAKLLRVIDGDTLVCETDLGFRLKHKTTLRLARINAPEPRGKTKVEGDRATLGLTYLMAGNGEFYYKSTKLDSFGRAIADIYFRNGQNVNDLMVSRGWATLL